MAFFRLEDFFFPTRNWKKKKQTHERPRPEKPRGNRFPSPLSSQKEDNLSSNTLRKTHTSTLSPSFCFKKKKQLTNHSQDEVKEIIRRRRGLEFGVNKRETILSDFLHYIQYEINLSRLIKSRIRLQSRFFFNALFAFVLRSRSLSYCSPITQYIDRKFTQKIRDCIGEKRVHILFLRAQKRFFSDLIIWEQHILFATQHRHFNALSKIFAR